MAVAIQSIWLTGETIIGPTLSSWWENPLLRHARRKNPLSWQPIKRWFGVSMVFLTCLVALAWIANWRSVGALLIGINLGGVLIVGLAAPVLSADRVARQMRFPGQDPRRLADLEPHAVVWGLALVTLWQLRWLILIGLVMTPALVVGVLRLDVANFVVWQDSAQALGVAAPASISSLLPPDGHIPYFRLVIRALSAGMLPWIILPLLASAGVTAALVFRDASLSPLVGLLGGLLMCGLILLGWNGLTRTPLLAGSLEAVRLIMLIGMIVGIGAATVWLNRRNGGLLSDL